MTNYNSSLLKHEFIKQYLQKCFFYYIQLDIIPQYQNTPSIEITIPRTTPNKTNILFLYFIVLFFYNCKLILLNIQIV